MAVPKTSGVTNMVARSPSTALEDAVGKIWNSSVPINHGNVSAIYFRTFIDSQDLNPGVHAFQKKFVSEVRRCDEMERKLRFFEKEIKKDGLPMFGTNDNPEAPQPKEMVELEMTFEKLEKEVKIVNRNSEELKRTYLNLTELRSMLKKTQQFFDETPKLFLEKLKEDLTSHYSFELEGSSIEEVVAKYGLNKTSILRSFCLKTGIQLLLRDYKFDQENSPTFNEDDVLNVFPVVKHIQPKATDALNFYATGQAKIQQGHFKEGYELISEALNLLNNVYGALHPEITQCLRMLARLNYVMGDHVEAMACQQKAVLMSEKANGIDHSTTITEYTHLALYCFANQQVTVALKLLYRARYLLLLNSGERHPEMAVIDSNIGLILHSVGEYEISLQFLKNALNLNIFYYGGNSLKVAVSYDLVARAQSCLGDFRSALHNEKETYSIYKQQLGEKHEKSVECSENLRFLTQQAVTLQKRMNELSKGKSAAVPSLQIQQPSINSILQTLNVLNGIIQIPFNASSLSAILKESAAASSPSEASEKKIEKMIEDTTLD